MIRRVMKMYWKKVVTHAVDSNIDIKFAKHTNDYV